MKSIHVDTYIDSNIGVHLLPTRSRLLFAAYLEHGPGFSEEIEYRVGPSDCGRFDVLWNSTDWEGPKLTAVAWLPRHQMRGKALHVALLKGLFESEMALNGSDGPNFNEVIDLHRSLLSAREVREISTMVFRDKET